jgi:DNA-binding LacI/PurR family transcriptional regulator
VSGTGRPTLDTVARELGVSRATVSNAYNRPDQLSVALRAQVIATARRLGYAGPDPVARSLARQQSATVAFMLPARLSQAFSDPALTIVLDALAIALDREDHALVLLPGTGGGPRPELLARVAADVAIAYGLPKGAPALKAVKDRRMPLVVIDSPATAGAIRVEVADRTGAALAAQHLLDLGHRRIGVISFQLSEDSQSGPASVERLRTARYRTTRERLTGYLDTLSQAGIGGAEVPIWECAANRRTLAHEGISWLLTQKPPPTAVLCTSDELALGALRAAQQIGLPVPNGLSVVGFDDTPAAAEANPPLTTVRQPLKEKGTQAAALALQSLSGSDQRPANIRLPVELITRGSTARMLGSRRARV